jgi:hypothetical protein
MKGFLEQVVEKWRTSDIGAGGTSITSATAPSTSRHRCPSSRRMPPSRGAP